mgnify:CR=1 FL=1
MKLYWKHLQMHLQSMMQYKTSFFLTALGQFLVSFNVFLGIYFMFQRFHQVAGFTYSQCLLCFAVTLSSFTLAEVFFRGFDTFASCIANGEFDRILVRPRGLVFQVICKKVELTRLGKLLQALVIFCYAVPNCGVEWNGIKILGLVLMVLGGTVVFASLFVLYAGICFFTLEGLEFMNVFTDGAKEFGKYPLGIYGKHILVICTFLVPYALFQYYPFLYLIGQRSEAGFLFLPLLSCLFSIPCYLFWRWGLRHYQSTGS